MPFAACVLLAIALGIVAYRSGLKRGTGTTQEKTVPAQLSAGSLEEQISDFGHERAELLAKLAVDDKAVAELKREMVAQGDELEPIESAKQRRCCEHQEWTAIQRKRLN